MSKSEGEFRRKIIKEFSDVHDVHAWPIENSAGPGMADILAVKETFFWIETKFCESLHDRVKFQTYQPNWIKKTTDRKMEVWIAIKVGKGHHSIFALIEGKNVHWVENMKAQEIVENHKTWVTDDFKKMCSKMLKQSCLS
jgi:hypothetical protein